MGQESIVQMHANRMTPGTPIMQHDEIKYGMRRSPYKLPAAVGEMQAIMQHDEINIRSSLMHGSN